MLYKPNLFWSFLNGYWGRVQSSKIGYPMSIRDEGRLGEGRLPAMAGMAGMAGMCQA